MKGMRIFATLQQAVNAGYQVDDAHYEITPGRFGMLVKTMTAAGWARALVVPERKGDDAA